MTFDPRDLLPGDLHQAHEALAASLEFLKANPQFMMSNEEAARHSKEPTSVRLVVRYHGEGHDLAQRVQPYAARGRGACSWCGHPVYYDDRQKMAPYMPMKFVCMPCMVRATIAEFPDLAPPPGELSELLACPPDCAWKPPAEDQKAC